MKIIILILFLSFASLAKAQITDTLNFDNYYPGSNNSVLVIDSMDGIWQVGKPNKTIFNSSLSLENAAVTDTLNYYPTNNDSYLYFHIDKELSEFYTGGYSTGYLEFYFQIDTDTLVDYGYLEFFDNSTSQWRPLMNGEWITTSSMYYMFYYLPQFEVPIYHSSLQKFTGKSLSWKHTKIELQCQGIFQPTGLNRGVDLLLFRFHFHSDSNNTNKEGWMIDQLLFQNFDGFGCPNSVSEFQNSIKVDIYPTLSSGQISFESESKIFSSITLFDFSGKQIVNYNFSPTNFQTLQLSNLSNGMYFYSIDNGKAKGKFIIEK